MDVEVQISSHSNMPKSLFPFFSARLQRVGVTSYFVEHSECDSRILLCQSRQDWMGRTEPAPVAAALSGLWQVQCQQRERLHYTDRSMSVYEGLIREPDTGELQGLCEVPRQWAKQRCDRAYSGEQQS
jgi:hypothetical protein